MRRFSIVTAAAIVVLAFAAQATLVYSAGPQGEVLEYKVMNIDPRGWVVTARETATGNVVKFRLPPAVFKGKTFSANLQSVKTGQRFSVRGPRNARLSQLVVEKPLPGVKRGVKRRQGALKMRKKRFTGTGVRPLAWEIVHVDARKWIVTAKNRQSGKIAKFQAHPEAFTGFLFRANLRSIGKGQNFSIVTPNNAPIPRCCTLLEIRH